MADWEEIKRLAADFQRTQTSDTLQRISERNCIDIVKKLTDLNLIELIYTCDGKEFLTPNHLLKEIEDEVYVNGGRVHLHDLAATLNVDYQHVENMSKQIVAERPDEYNLILGQIIHSTYKTTLEKQIYDTMIASGQLSIADFAKTLDLPSEFLSMVVKELLPKVMDDFVVSQDERTYYTTDMMDRYRSIIAGTLTAISKPTTIASIMKKLDISERLFTPIVDGLMKDGRIDAVVENRLFIPSIYAREQNEWIDKFYSSNSYIEYDVLSRRDIKQPKAFLKKRFPDGVQLKTCFVSPTLVSQVEALVEDCVATNSLIDISSVLPSSIQPDDIEQMLHDIFKKNKPFGVSCSIFNQTNVCSLGYIATCKKSFSDTMEAKAREHLRDGKLINYFLGANLKTAPSKSKQQEQQQQQQPEQQQKNNPDDEKKDEGDKNVKSVAEGQDRAPEKSDGKDTKKKIEDIELTAEDLKREKRHKKGKGAEPADAIDSDEDQVAKKSKSRKSGGGAQGREIKQKAVKKKYFAGKQRDNDDSDDDTTAPSQPKQSRSNKGRAARRGASPEPQVSSLKQAGSSKKSNTVKEEKEPLVFLRSEELVERLKEHSKEVGEFDNQFFESIANMLEVDLNKIYESIARKVLDEYLKTETEKETEFGKEAEVDLVD